MDGITTTAETASIVAANLETSVLGILALAIWAAVLMLEIGLASSSRDDSTQ